MNKQYIYELKIDNNSNYKIIDIGILAIEDECQDLGSETIYRRKHDIGYYITKSQTREKIIIILKSNKDLGESISCRLDLKPTYINQYATKLVCELIFVASDNNKYSHKAMKIKEVEDPIQYILDDYD